MQVEWRQQLVPGNTCAPVVALALVLELDALFVALASGQLLLLPADTREVEEVGSIEGGVLTAEWSPDGEVMALISAAGSLLIINQVCCRHKARLLTLSTPASQLAGPPCTFPDCPNVGMATTS